MASGKKGKKNKGITIPLTDFLQESGGTIPSQPIRKSTTNWSDEVDDYDAADPKIVNIALPTAPKASRDYDDIASKVPTEPPYRAYLSNLPYDVEEDEIVDFFKNMKISKLTIPKEDRVGEPPKLKGYGYVDFEDREDLLSALVLPETTLKNRRIRIEVASNTDNDKRRGGDWRSSNRPDSMDDRRGGRGFSGGAGGGGITREGMRDSNRDGDYGGFTREREGGFNRDRDFGRDRDSGFNRDGGFNRNRDQDDRPGAWRDGDRDNRGYSRPSYRDSERNRDDRDDRDRRGGGFRRYDDREERNGGFTRSSNRGDKDDRDSEVSSSEPRQRPRLQLAPRTKPLEQPAAKTEPVVPSSSIFGNAKPVDTAERERQIEEKLLKQDERLSEPTREKKEKGEETSEKRNYERGRPHQDDIEEETHIEEERKSRDRGPPSRDTRNASGEDSRRTTNVTAEQRSPDRKKNEKQDKNKHEEKRGKQETEMPKFQEPEPPNFQGSNKFALLDDDSD